MKAGLPYHGFMKRILLLITLCFFISFESNSQDMKVIELEPVEIIPSDQILVYSNFSKKYRENKANGLGSLGKVNCNCFRLFKPGKIFYSIGRLGVFFQL
jgi:hypothetical protein